jgi:hypothetical protein
MGDDETNRRRVRHASDRLLAAVEDLKATERRKRGVRMSSPEFHRLDEEVIAKTSEVWRAALEEDDAGDALSGTQAETTNDVEPERLE